MAVQAGFNSTQDNDTILASGIAKFIVPTPAASPLYEVLAMQFDCASLKSNVLDIPAWDAFPNTETTTEGDQTVSVNYSTSKKSITGGMLSTRALITDQVIQDSTLMESDMVSQMAANIRDAIDGDVLGLFVTATNQSDNSDVNLTITLLNAALALFRAQKPRGMTCFVGSPNQIRDLRKDLVAQGGANLVSGSANSIFGNMAIDGYLGEWGGMHFFESSNIQEADADNDNGGFVAVTAGSVGSSAPSMSGLGLGVWTPIQARGLYIPDRHGIDTTVSARIGVGRVAEYLVRGFISKKAA